MREVLERKLVAEELMELYEELPELVMYNKDLLTAEKMLYIEEIEEIAGMNKSKSLNPLDVVLESLINVLSEKFSIDTLTESKNTVYVDQSMEELAAQRIISLVKNDVSLLEEIHKKWLGGLRSFVSGLKQKGAHTLHEAIFQVSLKFRISASSSLKAIASLMQ